MTDAQTQAAVSQDALSALQKPSTSVEIRDRLIDLLRRDLIGPHPDLDPDLSREVLEGSTPSNWYLTGYLAPHRDAAFIDLPEEAAEAEMEALRGTEGLGDDATAKGAEEDVAPEPPKRSFLPSSLGLTVLVPEGVERIEARVTWGDYRPQPPLREALFLPERAGELEPGELHEGGRASEREWHRVPREERMALTLVQGGSRTIVPGSRTPGRSDVSDGLEVVTRVRDVIERPQPDGSVERLRAVTVFLVNRRFRVARKFADVANAHQARIELRCEGGFAPVRDASRYASEDADERLGDLHYRDVCAYATGHNTSAGWSDDGASVWTDPLPQAEVKGMRADIAVPDVERGMEALAEAADADDADVLHGMLVRLPEAYAEWATDQEAVLRTLPDRRRDCAASCLARIEVARTRIANGIRRLRGDRRAREAFAIMNRAVARSNRQRSAGPGGDVSAARMPEWRLFQLAFILINLDGLSDPAHEDRATVDLLFFPTGGGKTEAYLGLAAFAIARRRLEHRDCGAGLSVVMRYTLRLLTLDQLGRAAGLVCALELERQGRDDLGDWPIEIGLWVGGAATPNRLGKTGNTDEGTLIHWLKRHKAEPDRYPAPLPLKDCPWCSEALVPDCFELHPNARAPQRLDVQCRNLACAFGTQRLPIVAVDDELYRRLPAFMIATVDKFANVAWEGRTGAFFGHVTRKDPSGFYAAAEPRDGIPIDSEEPGRALPPIDLVIQDELHLISGPLGTVAGLYETAFDLLASRILNGKRVGPKIVASTATVRRAEAQIAALFGRARTDIFPPPGPSRDDSFFAETEYDRPGRLYVGIGGPGQGPKRVFLRALQTLLAGATALSDAGVKDDPADPYLTALCYFNALRELGGARRIVDDEVRRNLGRYGEDRRRKIPPGMPFTSRSLNETRELTSRVSTDAVAAARKSLGLAAGAKEATHVALATNMISVGLDIGRLGLMVVQGQPKTTSEYIQATSRVGRTTGKPGLVAALLNLHKPRDRAHFEQFRAFHASFYRSVEATSVTPFAPRALDRALAATLVAATRHVEEKMTPRDAVIQITDHAGAVARFREALTEKLAIAGLGDTETVRVLARMDELHGAWEEIVAAATAEGGDFGYEGKAPEKRLLQDPLKSLATDMDGRRGWFAAARSMRDTEPAALLTLRRPDGSAIDGGSA